MRDAAGELAEGLEFLALADGFFSEVPLARLGNGKRGGGLGRLGPAQCHQREAEQRQRGGHGQQQIGCHLTQPGRGDRRCWHGCEHIYRQCRQPAIGHQAIVIATVLDATETSLG